MRRRRGHWWLLQSPLCMLADRNETCEKYLYLNSFITHDRNGIYVCNETLSSHCMLQNQNRSLSVIFHDMIELFSELNSFQQRHKTSKLSQDPLLCRPKKYLFLRLLVAVIWGLWASSFRAGEYYDWFLQQAHPLIWMPHTFHKTVV